MKYRPDVLEVLERFKMWWNQEDFGRCAISILARDYPNFDEPAIELPVDIKDRWLDFDYLKASADRRLRNTVYIAEALPVWDGGYPGHDALPTFLGCDIEFGEDTAWINPIMENGDLEGYDPNDLTIDWEHCNNKWFMYSQKYHAFENECAAGNSMPAMPAMGSTGDLLAHLRTTQRMLLDVVDSPEMVMKFEDRLMTLLLEQYDHYHDIHKDYCYGGSTNWMDLWAPGKHYIVSNDFSYNISTKMFEEIFLNPLLKHIRHLDYSLYHVDGIEAFRHVDMLCSIKELTGLQILPGAGKPSPLHYMDVLKKVQKAGKNLHINIAPDEVETALNNLSSKGLFIETSCTTKEEGMDILKLVEKCSNFY